MNPRALAIKLDVVQHYGGKCECCGENEILFLTIHHKNGGGTEHRKELFGAGGGTKFYRWLIQHNYPLQYAVLCANCHTAIAIEGVCPHTLQPLL